MVVLILTRLGFDDMRSRVEAARDAVWVNAGVLSPTELAELRAAGWNLTDFVHRLDAANLASDIETVREHHPNQIIWVEAASGRAVRSPESNDANPALQSR